MRASCLFAHRYLVGNSERRLSVAKFGYYDRDGETNHSTPRKLARYEAGSRRRSFCHGRDKESSSRSDPNTADWIGVAGRRACLIGG